MTTLTRTAPLVFLLTLLAVSPARAALSRPIIVNHQSVALFDQLSDSDINRAKAYKFLFRHASVGGNIKNYGLTPLSTQNSKYTFSNWIFSGRPNDGWQYKIDDLVSQVASNANSYDVFSMKYCFVDPDANWDYYRTKMEFLQSTYPTKQFIWWTIPLLTISEYEDTSQPRRIAFNNNLRTYAQTHNIALLDIAAIESHDSSGNNCLTDRTNLEGLCLSYASDNGHLNTTGATRVAKALWYLMAQLDSTSSSSPSPSPSPSLSPSPSPSLSPSPSPRPGDSNGDGKVNKTDYDKWWSKYLQNTSGASNGDFNDSGRVDGIDYVIFLTNYLP